MPLSEYDHVIEALSANAPNQPFRERILPWTFRRCEHLLDSHSLNRVGVGSPVTEEIKEEELETIYVPWR